MLTKLASYLGYVPKAAAQAKPERKPRPEPRVIRGTYDAAQTTDEFKNYWANADYLDADSAHSKAVRHALISRSRYEVGNNGYADGIASTAATDLIGVGPTLRMQTGSPAFNQMVEREWYLWCKATSFRRKLWCMAHAKHVDGEAIAVMRRNPRLNHPLKLDLVLYEAEQCQTPYPWIGERGRIDGIKFDEFGNPETYEILRDHPGASPNFNINLTAEQVPASSVLHWFKMRRPGQHRGVPETASTLNTGAAGRRFREATVAAAETAADFTTLLQTKFPPDENDQVTPLTAVDIQKRMMVALPGGYEAMQMKAEHPASTYESFHKLLINEQARPKSMPYNKAACDSSSYNYASGRLDHQTYYAALDIEREDCNDLVLDRIFDSWFSLAIAKYNWLGGNPDAVGAAARIHTWDWPKHPVADIVSESNALQTKLRNGITSLRKVYSDAGADFEDEILTLTEDYFGDASDTNVNEMRKILRVALFNSANQQAAMTLAEAQTDKTAAETDKITQETQQIKQGDVAAILRNGKRLNGVSHAN